MLTKIRVFRVREIFRDNILIKADIKVISSSIWVEENVFEAKKQISENIWG